MDSIYTSKQAQIITTKTFSIALFPALIALFIFIYFFNKDLYYQLTSEDGLVEWATFFCLFISSVISLNIAFAHYKEHRKIHPFFAIFFLFNLLAGFEEISWGQRLFQMESGEFFNTYSDQKEINLHNTFQGIVGIKTKHIALAVLFVYGVVLPWKSAAGTLNWKIIKQKYLVIPPVFLLPAFILATLLMLDFPTGNEEEIGEFFYSMCFLLTCIYSYQVMKHSSNESENVIIK